MARIAVVTGGNKGIGYAVVRGLCKVPGLTVYLTARDAGRGNAAVEELKKEGHSPHFHQLDVDSKESAAKLRDFLVEKHGGLDVLVNNAGMAYKQAATEPFSEQAEVTVRTNYYGLLNICSALFPILRPHARVVNVSSMVSSMVLPKLSAEVKARVLSVKTVDDVSKIMDDFVATAKAEKMEGSGFAQSAYGMSKIGVTAVTPVQQEMLANSGKDDIVVNACCPGYVSTDMSSHKGHKTIDEGARVPLHLALLAENDAKYRGKFLRENEKAEVFVQPWE